MPNNVRCVNTPLAAPLAAPHSKLDSCYKTRLFSFFKSPILSVSLLLHGKHPGHNLKHPKRSQQNRRVLRLLPVYIV